MMWMFLLSLGFATLSILNVPSSWWGKRQHRLEPSAFQIKSNWVIRFLKVCFDLRFSLYHRLLSIASITRIHQRILLITTSDALTWIDTALDGVDWAETLPLVRILWHIHLGAWQDCLNILLLMFARLFLNRILIVYWWYHSPLTLLSFWYSFAHAVECLRHPILLWRHRIMITI